MRLLLIENDAVSGAGVAGALGAAGYEVVAAASAEAGLDLVDAGPFSAALVDQFLPGMSGVEFVTALAGRPGAPAVFLMDEAPTVPGVVLAMREGAAGYLQKPVDLRLLARDLARCLGPGAPALPAEIPPPALDLADPAPDLVGVSAGIVNVKHLIRAAARTSSPVLIYGPSGTGKELVAESIHARSARATGPFVPVNCGALPEGLAESELFGAERGAYTGAGPARAGLVQAADGGTLFLDELGEMPPPLQVKLLRVLQKRVVRRVGGTAEHPVDVRVIAATNREPRGAVRDRVLREDLYYRLAVIQVVLEPLTRRPQDLEPLCLALLKRLATRYPAAPLDLSPAALAALRAYPWPGNVRELENVLDLVCALGQAGDRIELAHLPAGFAQPGEAGAGEGSDPDENPVPVPTLREAENGLIRRAMTQAGGNKAEAARLLGISRPYLYRRLAELAAPAKPPAPR